ncbi:phospholipase [Rhodocytophaga aerolata]|uniref:Phospholipase n=1 Tax=Rhodocytophaga aerolata TaxID=455078 RepID=A0ABT8RGL1_9BACT|nr:phospholipase [Rhodocytophaga aerolata]MDO1449950.1 phospholipase [Rhodocytophaga aerolata]
MIIHNQPVQHAGNPLSVARKVLIMVHGRGDSAKSFIGLSSELNASVDEFAFLAIQAIQNTWYPYSFLAPVNQNEPNLSLSLSAVSELLDDLMGLRFSTSQIYFLAFSQGACLTLEFCARHAKRYGGVIAFTGGLIGESLTRTNYKGNFEGTPIFIGSSEHDPHVPESRIEESQVILESMGANVIKKIYPGLGHTINHDELMMASLILNNQLGPKT